MKIHRMIGATAIAASAFILFAGAGPLSADSATINFENPPYTVGSPNGQDGWVATGSGGSGCAHYDHAISTLTRGFAQFGSQTLRMSNAVTSGCFGDQTFSKPLVNEAGESTAQNGGLSGGSRKNHFEVQFDIAAATSTYQPGLFVSTSADRGDGARMSYVRFDDLADGIHVMFDDYQDAAPFGTLANPALGCGVEDDFTETDIATINRTAPHTIKVVIDFVDGPRNDVVKVFVDGVLKKTGTTWEDYFRWCTESGGGVPNNASADSSRTVDSYLFRTGGTPAPATLGAGYIFDNLSLSSSNNPSCATPSAPVTQTYTSSGTFAVPVAYCSLTVQAWGGGGSGSPYWNQGGNGSASGFSSISAGGGFGARGTYPGSGGAASGGTTNSNGNSGQDSNSGPSGAGGSAPNGGAGGAGGTNGGFDPVTRTFTSPNGHGGAGSPPGGGGGGQGGDTDNGINGGAGGGSGAYASKTYASGALTGGSNVGVTVGSGGADPSGVGGSGARGQVTITYTTPSN